MLHKTLALAVLTLCLAACGDTEPEAGDDCEGNTGACTSSSTALLCEGGTLRLFNCRGAAGCIGDDEKLACDLTNARPGDRCRSVQENLGQCDASNANQLLRCSEGSWRAAACKGCAVQSGSIVCQP
ncbi:hypothetical protein [Stigmatella erecta]|uniref:Lipoprotein n=1 Tax=Stigmatella erecta TaxID=83460 RepID=A0A1I0LA46_9BACT|nr:hypothetical protein [Stigmatella erecta]SEU36980.1 hypothetical protein SAMN05443639_12328 [Stigmatella erecta]